MYWDLLVLVVGWVKFFGTNKRLVCHGLINCEIVDRCLNLLFFRRIGILSEILEKRLVLIDKF